MSLISVTTYPVKPVLKTLLQDKTTNRNIIFAEKEYISKGADFDETNEITPEKLLYMGLVPRVEKEKESQQARTKQKAEVFTPSWICNKMNNHCDEEWFGRPDVFNKENEKSWTTNQDKIDFGELSWQDYIDSLRIEITCGEAPYIVSRYDTTTGEIIPIKDRIGILDRKLRVINENAKTDKEWLEWTFRAFKSVYGYEFQGDNLLIARINLLNTFTDYFEDRFGKEPNLQILNKIADIITWNFWQMNGLTGTVPFYSPRKEHSNITIFEYDTIINPDEAEKQETIPQSEIEMPLCQIFDWKENKPVIFTNIGK